MFILFLNSMVLLCTYIKQKLINVFKIYKISNHLQNFLQSFIKSCSHLLVCMNVPGSTTLCMFWVSTSCISISTDTIIVTSQVMGNGQMVMPFNSRVINNKMFCHFCKTAYVVSTTTKNKL